MRYLKTFENFGMGSNREEMIETLCSTSTFEREELEAMTDDELDELYHTLETEDWINELDRETKGGEHWIGGPYHSREEEEGDYFESYTFEDFTHSDMEDVKELLVLKDGVWVPQIGLDVNQIAIELDLEVSTVRQIISSLNKSQQNKIYIPMEYSGVIMELGEEVDAKDIISLYNEIVVEGTPLVDYSEYGTKGMFYNEDNDEIPLNVILDELNYAIGLDGGELEGLDESKKSGVTKSLKKKSKASGIPMGILRKVFAKGMQAWNAGHRPGVAQHQWGMGRVNSFITGAGGARKADAALWAKAKAAKARKKKKK
jgi:hypothetical protein